MPTYDRRRRFNYCSDNPYDGVPFGPRLWRNHNDNRSSRPRNNNLPPRTIRNRHNNSDDGYDHQNSNSHRHSLNASNHHHHPHRRPHHQRQQQIVPFYNNVERYYHAVNVIVLNEDGEIQEWYYVYDTLVMADHHHDDTVEQSRSDNEGLSEEGLSKCLKLKTKGDSEEGICVICQDDLFPYKEEEQEENDRQKVVSISPCGHEYHYNCVAKWLQQKNSCPLCKATPRLES